MLALVRDRRWILMSLLSRLRLSYHKTGPVCRHSIYIYDSVKRHQLINIFVCQSVRFNLDKNCIYHNYAMLMQLYRILPRLFKNSYSFKRVRFDNFVAKFSTGDTYNPLYGPYAINYLLKGFYRWLDFSSQNYKFIDVDKYDYDSGSSQFVITRLRKYTKYEIVVQAINPYGEGPLSRPSIGQTQEDSELRIQTLKLLHSLRRSRSMQIVEWRTWSLYILMHPFTHKWAQSGS